MDISLIIATYNWPEALAVVLATVARQSELPREVIVADDGSGAATKRAIENARAAFPVPLIHSWQPDQGFRAAASRNRAIAKAQGAYIVFIDGDILLSPHFIEDHRHHAARGIFVQGGRALLNPGLTARCIAQQRYPRLWEPGVGRRKNLLRGRAISQLFSYTNHSYKSARTCNMAVWKNNLVEVNGFNEAIQGWGREDTEISARLINAGLRRLYLRYAANSAHLCHAPIPRNRLQQNDAIAQQTIQNKLTYCELGLAQYTTSATGSGGVIK